MRCASTPRACTCRVSTSFRGIASREAPSCAATATTASAFASSSFIPTRSVSAPSLRRYERYLFGPWAGLIGSKDKVVVPVGLLAVDPDSLLAATREFVGAAGHLR